MATVDGLMTVALAQRGKQYVYAVQPSSSVADPDAFDCSGFTAWCLGRIGIPASAGSWVQARWCRDQGTLMSIDDAIATRGALLFRGPNDAYDGFGPEGHVAFSLGDGTTVEARGSQFGVNSFSAAQSERQWSNAALVPELVYFVARRVPAPPAPSPAIDTPTATVALPRFGRLPNGRWRAYSLKIRAREVWAWNDAPLAPYPKVAVVATQIPGLHVIRLDEIARAEFGIPRFQGTPVGLFVSHDGGLVVQMDDGGTIDIRTTG